MDNIIVDNLKGFEIKLATRPGVFSWRGADNGTRLLIENMQVKDGSLIADLCSGIGILGIVCAKLNYSGHVHLLEDHLRSKELAEENIELNDVGRNAEVYLSDLFSAVPGRTYHQIYSNPPAQMGNDFLEEVVTSSLVHLKPQGELWFVVPKNLKSVISRLFEKYFGGFTMVAQGREHVVLKAKKQ